MASCQRLHVGDGGSSSQRVLQRMRDLAVIDPPDGNLATPVRGGGDGESGGERIDATAFDTPALFVGFLAVETGGFQRDPARGNPCREGRSGNMGRILFLVCQHRHRVFGSGDTMREGCGAEGRFAGLEKDRVTAIRDSSRVATAGLHALQAAVVHGGLVRARPADL